MNQDLDLTGQTFGRWKVLSRAPDRGEPSSNRKYKMWRYRCSCESHTIKDVYECHLLRGNSKSCGCLAAETCGDNFRTHGESESRLYRIWENMKKRCNCVTNSRYKDYGGRGITICKEWNDSYEAFKEWAIHNGYDKKLTIDRINNDGNYEPSNCRWADTKTQNKNRRCNVWITARGETHTITEWAEKLQVPSYLISYRRNHGWSDEDALFKPLVKPTHAVISIDDNGNTTRYESIKDASKATGIKSSNISASLSLHRKAGGLTWVYANPDEIRHRRLA